MEGVARIDFSMIFKFLNDFKLTNSKLTKNKDRDHYKSMVKKINEL